MQDRIQLLNVSVDIASTGMASEATIDYLKTEGSRVVYFLNSETLLTLGEDDALRETVENSNLVLPGTPSVNQSINDVLGHRRDAFFVESYFDALFDYVVEMGLEVLVVAQTKERLQSIEEHIQAKHEFITLTGVCLYQQDESTSHIVNEINSVAPDVLLVALEEKIQLELLEKYRRQINASLMIFTGTILYNRVVSDAQVPEKIQRLRIDSLYKWYRKDGRIRSFFSNIRMKMKLKKHKKEQES